jgi:hypothetical protein
LRGALNDPLKGRDGEGREEADDHHDDHDLHQGESAGGAWRGPDGEAFMRDGHDCGMSGVFFGLCSIGKTACKPRRRKGKP